MTTNNCHANHISFISNLVSSLVSILENLCVSYKCFHFTAKATYAAIAKTYAYLTPDLWKDTVFSKSPYQEFSDHLAKSHKPVSAQKQEVKQY